MDNKEAAVTAEGSPIQWLTPRQALSIVNETFQDIAVSARAILEHLRGGQIRAIAGSIAWEGAGQKGESPIPANYWLHLTGKHPDWWDTSAVRFFFPRDGFHSHSRVARCFGIRLHLDDVRKIIDGMPQRRPRVLAPANGGNEESPSKETNANKGGRPRNDYWDDL